MGEADNEQVVRQAGDAWNADDYDAMEALCHPDVGITTPQQCPETRDFNGWPAIQRQYERIKDPWSEEQIELGGRVTWTAFYLDEREGLLAAGLGSEETTA